MQSDDPSQQPQGEDFRNGMPFLGGSLWLDLLNTAPSFPTGPVDFLAAAETAEAWLLAAGLPGQGREAAALRDLRQELRSAHAALREGRPLPEPVIQAVNRALAGQRRHLVLRQTAHGPQVAETIEADTDSPAARIAEDFARFVSEYEAARLKCCDNPACNLVFYDRGKSRRRRWCAMSACGNRDKVARFRQRHAQD